MEIGEGETPVIRGVEREEKFETDPNTKYIGVDRFAYNTKRGNSRQTDVVLKNKNTPNLKNQY